MLASQEPKYGVVDGRIVNRATGKPIPDNEPIFILRAKDKHAVRLLEQYFQYIENPEHENALLEKVKAFKRFANAYPELMKEPDTE